MGDVYHGRQPDMGNRVVAIKIPKRADPHVQRRFEREISASARLQHENIVRAFDRGSERGWPYLVMEFVPGQSLGQWVRQDGPLTVGQAVRVTLGVARGLAHAHQSGVINRDIKPDNILVGPDFSIRILDFGLALIKDARSAANWQTLAGVTLGTPAYMAPEQFEDPHNVGASADVYALGCTLFACLSGQPPFQGDDLNHIRTLHAQAERPCVSAARQEMPPAFDALIRQMMAIDARQRPSAVEILARLEAISTEVPFDGTAPVVMAEVVEESESNNQWGGDIPPVATPDVLAAELVPDGSPSSPSLDNLPVLPAVMVDASPSPRHFPPAVDELPPVVAASIDDAPPIAPAIDGGSSGSGSIEVLRAQVVSATTSDVPMLPVEMISAGDVPPVAAQSAYEPLSTPPRQISGSENATTAMSVPSSRWTRQRVMGLIIGGACAVMIVAAMGLYGFNLYKRATDAEVAWTALQDDFSNQRWGPVKRELTRFGEKFPASPHTEKIPYFVDMCDAAPDIYSRAGKAETGLAKAQTIFKNHRDTPAYRAYCGHFHDAVSRLVERFVEKATSEINMENIAQARSALELLRTVGESITDEQAGQQAAALATQVDSAERQVKTAVARKKILGLYNESLARNSAANPDEVYAAESAVVREYPELAQDGELSSVRKRLVDSESARVRYVAESEAASNTAVVATYENERGKNWDSWVIAWGTDGASGRSTDAEQVLLATARGVLYVFRPNGDLIWSRRLGVDSHRLPLTVPSTAISPMSVVAVSTDDGALVSWNAMTGREQWRYPAGEGRALSAPMCVVTTPRTPDAPAKQRGLLPTANGEVHVVELVLGRRVGRFVTGQTMTVRGTYDPRTKLVYFPAESRRVFAIDPAVIDVEGEEAAPAACRGVLFTEHAAGSLRSAPIVAGDYLALVESSSLEGMRIRVYSLNEPIPFTPHAEVAREHRLDGWSWFDPVVRPDRLALVTDEGHLGIFGINLDNHEEAIFPLLQDEKGSCRRLPVHDPFRAAVVHSEEHAIWAFAGGELAKYGLNVIEQNIKPIWPSKNDNDRVTGVPLHEPQVDVDSGMLYVATMAADGYGCHFTAVDVDGEQILWRRQLGLQTFGDPIVTNQGALLVDRLGHVVPILTDTTDTQQGRGDVRVRQLSGSDGLPPRGAAEKLMSIRSNDGQAFLMAPWKEGSGLFLRALAEVSSQQPWREVHLPAPLAGRPAHCGAYMVAPCADGTVVRIPLESGQARSPNEVPEHWRRADRPQAGQRADVYPLPDGAVLVADEAGLRRLAPAMNSPIEGLRWDGLPFEAKSPLIAAPVVAGQRVAVADALNAVHVHDCQNPARILHRWQLDQPISAMFRRGEFWLALLADQTLVCLDDQQTDKPRWRAGPFAARVAGMPALMDDVLLVADRSGRVTGLRLQDGSIAWELSTPSSAGAAAAAAPLGSLQIALPLDDGTVAVRRIPQNNAKIARSP